MSLRSALLAATAFLATANAHITMEFPVPYSLDKLDSEPLSGANFPCKSTNGFTVTKMNNMKVGEKLKVSFKGTAVHGGGSCQLSYTQDTTPSASSKFKVIKTIEGGCPGLNGATSSFDFSLPAEIPNGKGTFAWTWNSKQAGKGELYMNCAPIDVTGGASDASKLSSLPDTLFVNVDAKGGQCKQVENKAVKFPNPGKDHQVGEQGAVAPTGSCGGSAGDSSPAPPSTPSSAAGEPTKPASSAATNPSTSAATKPSATGPVLAPSEPASSAAPTTLATQVAPPTTASPPTATAPPTTPPTTGGASGTCSTDGAIVCNGASQFGICNRGAVVWQSVAAGTQCANGVISKRGYNGRFARRA